MRYSLIGVIILLFSIVLLCDAVVQFWCKFSENGLHTNGYYCDSTPEEFEQQHGIDSYCSQFMQSQPNVTFVSQFKFRKCDFDFINQKCKRAEYLRVMDISYSNLDRLNFEPNLFDGLKVLNASHNRLTEVSPTLPKLSEVDFSYNKLQHIDANTFANASQLIRIGLSNNNLTTIDDAAFTALIHLQSINLSGNQIQTLEPLQNNRQLQIIRAIDNPISTFDCDYFTKMDTISVLISWNRLKKLNLACKKSTTPLRVISNGTAELIVLHHSAISQANDSEIHCTAGSMTHIESCTITGRNTFRNVTQLLTCFGAKLKRLTLSGIILNRTATAALTSTFQRFTELEWLNMKDTALTEFDFRAIQHQIHLMRLDLSLNNLSELKNPSLLLRFSLLREFKVFGNQIQNTAEIIASLKESLKWLDLSDNFVGMVNRSTFQRLEYLTTLKLSNTSLMLPGNQNPFEVIKNLSIFDVSQNNLSAVNFGQLAGTLGQLTRFFAANCQLSNASNVIRYLGEQQLLELDLSGNDFSGGKFTDDTFKRLTKLQNLHLNDANLRSFNLDKLRFNREIRALKLSDNKLQSIEMRIAMENLKRLDLDGNELIHLDGLRSMMPQLDYLAISKNRLECEYLIQLQRIFAGVKLIGDPFQHQKHRKNCYLKMNNNQVGMGMNERKKYAIGLLIAIAVMPIAMIFVTWFFCCRKPKLTRSEETLKRIRQSMRDSEYFVPNFRIPDEDDEDEHLEDLQENNEIYEEIPLEKQHDYDHLHRSTDPMPFEDDSNENYLHIGLINGRISSRNVTNRL